jgi:hypothetical protein
MSTEQEQPAPILDAQEVQEAARQCTWACAEPDT